MFQDYSMLIRVKFSRFTNFKHDRALSDATAVVFNGRKKQFRSGKYLVDETVFPQFGEIVAADNETTNVFLAKYTRPWLDKGYRILPTTNLWEVMDGLSERSGKRETLVSQLPTVDEVKQHAKLVHGDAFRDSDFPEDFKSQYAMDIIRMPIPRAGDFRMQGLDQDDIAKIEADLLERIGKTFGSADLWQRIHNSLVTDKGPLGDRLRAYGLDPITGKVVNKFHDTLIENVVEVVTTLPNLNIAQDPKVTEICDRLTMEVARYNPQELRDNPVLREDVAAQADKILAEVSAFMA